MGKEDRKQSEVKKPKKDLITHIKEMEKDFGIKMNIYKVVNNTNK
jgi:hypothetical protein